MVLLGERVWFFVFQYVLPSWWFFFSLVLPILQVTSMLEKLDMFLKRIEPEIESITGEERDTASFMKMMRLFNEVSGGIRGGGGERDTASFMKMMRLFNEVSGGIGGGGGEREPAFEDDEAF